MQSRSLGSGWDGNTIRLDFTAEGPEEGSEVSWTLKRNGGELNGRAIRQLGKFRYEVTLRRVKYEWFQPGEVEPMPIVYVLIAGVAVAIAVFALQNSDQVTIRFLIWKVDRAPLPP